MLRFRALLSESRRNLASGAARAVIGALLLCVVSTGLLLIDGMVSRDIFTAQQRLLSSGAATVTVTAPDGISGSRCVALNDVAGVRGAMAIRAAPDRLVLVALPESSIAAYEVAGEIDGTLGGSFVQEPGLFVSSQLGEQLGLEPRDSMALAGAAAPVMVAGVFRYPADGRTTTLASAILVPSAAQATFDACWVTIWPADKTLNALSTSTLDVGTDDGASSEIGQLNVTLGAAGVTDDLLRSRATWALPVMVAAVASLVGFAVTRSRRLDLALSRHLGQTRASQILQTTIETTAWAGIALLSTATILLLVTVRDLNSADSAWMVTRIGISIASVGCATLFGMMLSLVDITGDRMYRWSKNR